MAAFHSIIYGRFWVITKVGKGIDTLVRKYADHRPLYRQSSILKRDAGIEISRATMCGWIMRVGELLIPVVGAMRKELLAGSYIHADETPVDVQTHDGRGANHHPAGERGRLRSSTTATPGGTDGSRTEQRDRRCRGVVAGPMGRSVTDRLAMLQELEHLGVGFVSLTEALDLTTPAGRAMAALLAVFAAFEREILGERVRAGLDHARQNGKRLGQPATATLHAERVRKLRRSGLSKSEIARRLQIGRTSVRCILDERT
jgi:Transposase IS66 family/Resolvase, N terminal domain